MRFQSSDLLIFLIILCSPSLTIALEPQLTYEETSRGHHFKEGPILQIQLIPKDFPPNTPVKISMTRLNDEIINCPIKFRVNEKNELIDENSGAIARLNFTHFAKGEPVFYTITSDDRKWTASTKIIPFPIEVRDSEGRCLSMELASPDGMLFQVNLSGFKPLENVEISSLSGKEKLHDRFQVSENGTEQITLMPAVKGKKSGKASLFLKLENQRTLKLNYEWGVAALKDFKQT